MKKYFVAPNDPILNQTAKPIPPPQINSPATKKIVEKMLNVAYGEQTDRNRPLLVGLAAPQVGISKRIILVDVSADGQGKIGKLKVFINPEITWQAEEESEWYEGCFSTDRVCGIVSRPVSIKIKAYNQDGQIVSGEYSGYVARIFQHEIDHLNGKEFVSHITDDQRLHWVEETEFLLYRNKQAWRNWSKKCSRDRWEKIKGLRQ